MLWTTVLAGAVNDTVEECVSMLSTTVLAEVVMDTAAGGFRGVRGLLFMLVGLVGEGTVNRGK